MFHAGREQRWERLILQIIAPCYGVVFSCGRWVGCTTAVDPASCAVKSPVVMVHAPLYTGVWVRPRAAPPVFEGLGRIHVPVLHSGVQYGRVYTVCS